MMTQRRIYQEEFPYFVTTNTFERVPIFLDEQIALKLGRAIVSACAITEFSILAYAILPDHLHLLVQKSKRGF
ncbi:MAG: transposase [Candidatus Kerfeldbacteria bacterium]|nr:transposase [Candidatus Kerfeldbacteria bacterium]